MGAYWYLGIAIIAEVIATCFLKAAEGFTKPLPSLAVIIGYGAAFYCLSVVIKTLPVSVVYAIWTGCGVLLVALASVIFLKQTIDLAAILGMVLIVCGVIVIQLFSDISGPH